MSEDGFLWQLVKMSPNSSRECLLSYHQVPRNSLGAGTTSVNEMDENRCPRGGMGVIFTKHGLYFRHCTGLDIHHCKTGTTTSTLRMRKLRLKVNNFSVATCSQEEARLIVLNPRAFLFCRSPGTKMAVRKQASGTFGGTWETRREEMTTAC